MLSKVCALRAHWQDKNVPFVAKIMIRVKLGNERDNHAQFLRVFPVHGRAV